MGLYRGSTQSSSQTPFYFVVSALTTLMLFGLIQPSSSSSSPNKLLLILVDGFRWDYFDKLSEDELPGFTRLRQNGVSAEAFMPVFPSLSFANYYSIMTGNIYFYRNIIHPVRLWDCLSIHSQLSDGSLILEFISPKVHCENRHYPVLLTLSDPRGWVLTLTDPRGGYCFEN